MKNPGSPSPMAEWLEFGNGELGKSSLSPARK